MYRLIIVILTLISFIGDAIRPGFGPTQAHAAAFAPAVAIGALELAGITVATAATIGAITAYQNEQYQRQISALSETIKRATGEILNAALAEANLLLRKISGGKASCNEPSNGTPRSNGYFCISSPEACCGDYLSKFSDRIEKGRGGMKMFKNGHHNKLSCCLEWDHTHGGFEIFDERGKHLGERGCDDMSDDPCAYSESRGRHARPASSTHKPRSPVCRR